MRTGRQATKYIIILMIILVLMIIAAASIGAAKVSFKETSIIIASFIPGINYLVDSKDLSPQDIAVISTIRLPRIVL